MRRFRQRLRQWVAREKRYALDRRVKALLRASGSPAMMLNTHVHVGPNGCEIRPLSPDDALIHIDNSSTPYSTTIRNLHLYGVHHRERENLPWSL